MTHKQTNETFSLYLFLGIKANNRKNSAFYARLFRESPIPRSVVEVLGMETRGTDGLFDLYSCLKLIFSFSYISPQNKVYLKYHKIFLCERPS